MRLLSSLLICCAFSPLKSSVSANSGFVQSAQIHHQGKRFRVGSDGTHILQRRCTKKDSVVVGAPLGAGSSSNSSPITIPPVVGNVGASACFPSAAWVAPSSNPTVSMSQWWCPSASEYNFMGFSYDIYQCPGWSQMMSDFSTMRWKYKARYIRIYNYCDQAGFLDLMVKAAYTSGIGIYYTLWVGYGDQASLIPGRMSTFKSVMNSNPFAPYVIRTVSIGSEGISQGYMGNAAFLVLMLDMKSFCVKWNIPVTASDAPWFTVYQAPIIWATEDMYSAHVLPAYDTNRVTDPVSAYNNLVGYAINTFTNNQKNNKKFVLTQAPWPSSGWSSNGFVGSISNQQLWFQTMNSRCKDWKAMAGGGGWFYHLWSDIGSGMATTSNYGIMDWNNNPKWDFSPTISC